MMAAALQRRFHECIPFTGETTGLIREVLPAAEIVQRIVAEARARLDQAGRIGR